MYACASHMGARPGNDSERDTADEALRALLGKIQRCKEEVWDYMGLEAFACY